MRHSSCLDNHLRCCPCSFSRHNFGPICWSTLVASKHSSPPSGICAAFSIIHSINFVSVLLFCILVAPDQHLTFLLFPCNPLSLLSYRLHMYIEIDQKSFQGRMIRMRDEHK